MYQKKHDSSVSRLIDETTAEYFLNLGIQSHDKVHDEDDVKYIITDKWQSRVFLANYQNSDVDLWVKKIISKAIGLKLPLLWYVSPNTIPKNLGKHLKRNGFVQQGEWSAMEMDLNLDEHHNLPQNMFKEVESPREMEQWIQILVEGFNFDENLSKLYREYFTKIPLENNKCKNYLGFYEGKPVSSVAIYTGKSAIGVFYLSTVPEIRNKGMGKLMMYNIMDEARNLGYSTMILQASSMGYPLYKRIGFKKRHTTMIYKLNPSKIINYVNSTK